MPRRRDTKAPYPTARQISAAAKIMSAAAAGSKKRALRTPEEQARVNAQRESAAHERWDREIRARARARLEELLACV